MNIDKPNWISHGDHAIFCIDAHPKGGKIVTAGSDTKVKVWNLAPVLDVRAELNEECPKLLATLNEHCAPVNVARFSHNGKQLATGSDDRLVFVFELRPGAGQAIFGSNDKPSLENWKHLFPLRGHSNNIVDLCWSPDDAQLATCSLDNSIIIWNTSTGKQVTTLEGHTSYVKGLAWDPIGSYLASQSDDRSIIVWRCSNWTPLITIKSIFEKGYIGQNFSLRLHWSVDGNYIVGVNSFQSPSHCAVIMHRGVWDKDTPLNIVGHKAAVVVVRWNPVLFKGPDDDEPAQCFALGSQDSKVTIWNSSDGRPRVILERIFTQSISDLTWTPDGLTLLACSTDGTVAVFKFEEGRLGEPLSQASTEAHIKQLYGERVEPSLLLAESAAQLDLEATASARKPSGASRPANVPPASAPPVPPVPAAVRGNPLPLPVVPSALTNGALDARLGSGGSSLGSLPPPRELSQRVALAPASTSGQQAGPGSLPAPLANSAAQRGEPAGVRPQLPAAPVVRRPTELRPQATPGQPPSSPAAGPSTSGGPSPGMYRGPGPPRLAVPPPPKALCFRLGAEEGGFGQEGRVRELNVANGEGFAEVACSAGGAPLWRDRLPDQVARVAGNLNFAAAALQNATLQVYTAGGRRMLPSISLGAPPLWLATGTGWRLLVVCADASVRLWDLQAQKLVVRASLPAWHHAEIVAVRLSGKGLPLVVLSDGSAHSLHLDLQEWLCVADPTFATSAFASALPAAASSTGELGRIQAEAAAPSRAAMPRLSEMATDVARSSDDSRRQLESNMAAALAMASPQDYRRWLLTYVRHLAGESGEGRLQEVCHELLGPVRFSEAGPAGLWQPLTMGLRKRDLLKEALREIGRHRQHQRFVAEFQDHLKAAEEHEALATPQAMQS